MPSPQRNASDTNSLGLEPAPIPAEWILEGTPRARCRIVSCNSEDCVYAAIWECSAGRFNWHYNSEVTIYVVEGDVIVRDAWDRSIRLNTGDTFFFPAGSRFQWFVPTYVRKVAFIHTPMSGSLRLARRIVRALKRPWSFALERHRPPLLPASKAPPH